MSLDVLIEQYGDLLKEKMSDKRYYHSVCVAKEAARLARLKKGDVGKAQLAGLLHDILKEMPLEDQLHYLKSHDILLSVPLLDNPFVWHGITGSIFLEQEMGIKDQEALNAVRYHTTSRAEMSLTEEIIFLADYTSKDREYPSVDMIRKLVGENWEKAIVECLSFGISEGIKKQTAMIPDAVEGYNYYLNKLNRKKG